MREDPGNEFVSDWPVDLEVTITYFFGEPASLTLLCHSVLLLFFRYLHIDEV